MSFIRTVLGDIAPSELGVCYAHEHLIIDASYPTEGDADFLLDSVELCVRELREFHAAGGRSMIDAMPCDAGRNVEKLAEVARESGVHVVAPTGAHLTKYYPHGHWSGFYGVRQLARLFIDDIQLGIDAHDYSGPLVRRTGHRAGVIKLATGTPPMTPRETNLFLAGAMAHLETGCPILTHTEQGEGALEQISLLHEASVDLSHMVLSHTDRKVDAGYHRELLSTGVCLEYDSAFRWKTAENPTLDLLAELYAEFPGQLMLGMDAARRGYWRAYGGQPGLDYLLITFRARMEERGLGGEAFQRIFIDNPAKAFAFAKIPNQPTP